MLLLTRICVRDCSGALLHLGLVFRDETKMQKAGAESPAVGHAQKINLIQSSKDENDRSHTDFED